MNHSFARLMQRAADKLEAVPDPSADDLLLIAELRGSALGLIEAATPMASCLLCGTRHPQDPRSMAAHRAVCAGRQ